VRHSESRATVTLGDRLFPGHHHRADFTVAESPARLDIAFRSRDDDVAVDVRTEPTYRIGGSELFENVADASTFFGSGAVGFSPSRDDAQLNGLELRTDAWQVEPLRVRLRARHAQRPRRLARRPVTT
jgi:hypothetical protein